MYTWIYRDTKTSKIPFNLAKQLEISYIFGLSAIMLFMNTTLRHFVLNVKARPLRKQKL